METKKRTEISKNLASLILNKENELRTNNNGPIEPQFLFLDSKGTKIRSTQLYDDYYAITVIICDPNSDDQIKYFGNQHMLKKVEYANSLKETITITKEHRNQYDNFFTSIAEKLAR